MRHEAVLWGGLLLLVGTGTLVNGPRNFSGSEFADEVEQELWSGKIGCGVIWVCAGLLLRDPYRRLVHYPALFACRPKSKRGQNATTSDWKSWHCHEPVQQRRHHAWIF